MKNLQLLFWLSAFTSKSGEINSSKGTPAPHMSSLISVFNALHEEWTISWKQGATIQDYSVYLSYFSENIEKA